MLRVSVFKRLFLLSCILTLVSFIAFDNSFAGVCNVPGDKTTIQAAINDPNCNPIHVSAGTYNENITINRALVLEGAGYETTTINGQGSGDNISVVYITASGDVTIKGFKIVNPDVGTNYGYHRFGIVTNSTIAGVTYTIEDNKIVGTNNPDAYEDYGIYGKNGGKENLVIRNNIVTETGANNILIERHKGTVEISGNKLDAGCYGVDPIFIMTYSGDDVTNLQKIHNNVIDLSTGGPFDYEHRATGITFAAGFTGTAGKFTNIQITENSIINLKPNRRGIGLWNNAGGDGSSANIINPVISLNTITGATGDVTDSMGIYTFGLVTDAIINGNTISGVDYSFKERKHGTYNHIATGTKMNYNSLTNNVHGAYTERTSGVVDAENNWWGCSAGPGNTGCDGVSSYIDYTPWLTKRLIPRVDLSVTALTAPTTAAAGSSITIVDTTKNKGNAVATPSKTGFYLSTDVNLDSADTKLGSRDISMLNGGDSDSGTTAVTIPSGTTGGTYYIIAKADDEDGISESNEYNTKVRPIKIGSDLVISVLTVPTKGGAGLSINITDITKNNGPDSAGASQTAFYLSNDTTLDVSDTLLGSRSVGSLEAGASSTGTTTVTIPTTTAPGIYYIIAKADNGNAVSETKEFNNTKAKLIRIGADLVVSALSIPSSAEAGSSIEIKDTTKNNGPGSAGASQTAFYLSNDTTLDVSDTLLGSRSVGSLGAGASSTGTTTVTIPSGTPPGRYYIIAKADNGGAVTETYENNNLRYKTITIVP